MFKLNVVQAAHGDCLILQCGPQAKPEYVLIDGGPAAIYEEHLRPKLEEIKAGGGQLDLAIVSHIDDDHIIGMLQLAGELRQQRERGQTETIGIRELWHNTFSQTMGADVETRFKKVKYAAGVPRGTVQAQDGAERSIAQGDLLTRHADALGIPINPEFTVRHLTCLEDAPGTLSIGSCALHIVGPTQKYLEALRSKWLEWLEKQEKRLRTRGATVKPDESVPNLSSIMVLAECEGKTMLLPGDGRGDDLLNGLEQANLLGPGKKRHVNVFKLAHHGSQRNATQDLFTAVTADTYVVSANGRYDNPDLNVLKWIAAAAQKDGRRIEIVVTNATDATRRLLAECPPNEYGYKLTLMEPGQHTITVELMP